MTLRLQTEHHFGFLSLKGGCTDSSESTLIRMMHRWKSHAEAHIRYIVLPSFKGKGLRQSVDVMGFLVSRLKWKHTPSLGQVVQGPIGQGAQLKPRTIGNDKISNTVFLWRSLLVNGIHVLAVFERGYLISKDIRMEFFKFSWILFFLDFVTGKWVFVLQCYFLNYFSNILLLILKV